MNVLRLFRLLGICDMKSIDSMISGFFDDVDKHGARNLLYAMMANCLQLEMYPDDIEAIGCNLDSVKFHTANIGHAEVMKVLDQDLFPHIVETWGGNKEDLKECNFRKVYLLALLVAKLLRFQAGKLAPTDRDSWSKKRIASDAKQIETLLRNSWMWQLNRCCPSNTVPNTSLRVIRDKLNTKLVTESFVKSFTTVTWGVKNRQPSKTPVSQRLFRDSKIATVSHLTHITRTDKQKSLRRIQPSQFGFIDAIYCTEGKSTGIVKALSMTTTTSSLSNHLPIVDFIESNDFTMFRRKDQIPNKSVPMINSMFMGWCDGKAVLSTLRSLKLVVSRDCAIVLDGD